MAAMPDSIWRQALQLRTVVGASIVCGTLLALDYTNVIDLSSSGDLIRPFTIVLLVFSGALAVSRIGALVYDRCRKRS
jgi:hypothetical protein